MIMFQVIMLITLTKLMIPPMVFRILHQNDIKTSLQRIKRLEKPTDSLKLRIKRPEKPTDSQKLNLISTSDGLESLLRNRICSTAMHDLKQ